MSDRELLEKAAKAAGYVVESMRSDGGAWCYPVGEQPDEDGDYPSLFAWHPADDDGDALRLAVRLMLQIDVYSGEVAVGYGRHKLDSLQRQHEIVERAHPDQNAATRRAIFRAAAAIGESM